MHFVSGILTKIQGDASSFTAKYALQFRNTDEKWKSIPSVTPLCRDHLEGDMLQFQSLLHLQHLWKKQVGKTKWSKERKKKPKNTEIQRSCCWCHCTHLQQEIQHILFIWCQIHHPLKWRYRLLLASIGIGETLQTAIVRICLALWYFWHQQLLNRYCIFRAFLQHADNNGSRSTRWTAQHCPIIVCSLKHMFSRTLRVLEIQHQRVHKNTHRSVLWLDRCLGGLLWVDE